MCRKHACSNHELAWPVCVPRSCLRVLRVSVKVPGVRVVVVALRMLIPSFLNTLAVGLLLYYIFAVCSGRCRCADMCPASLAAA